VGEGLGETPGKSTGVVEGIRQSGKKPHGKIFYITGPLREKTPKNNAKGEAAY